MSPAPQAPAVAIAMATFEPDLDLLAAQIESIREQTREDWTCVVSDDCSSAESFAATRELIGEDPRFALSRSERRLGFYRNFERALGLVPADVGLVALADQDDRWAPRKLEALAAAIGPALLVHSDARIVDREGRVLSPTYWRSRRPNSGDLASLLVANTVTGAASLFRRELLDRALPFPELPGQPYHDHWLALLALAAGEIAYSNEPLYDYVQHGAAVLGHVGGEAAAAAPRDGSRAERWRQAYLDEYRRVLGLAKQLAARCEQPLPDPRRARALRRFLATDRSPWGLAWRGWRAVRHSLGRSETAGAERTLVAGLAWYWLARARGRAPGRG
ncbi:MAG: glycosyltransferase [Solirubrobacterales bacterium]